MLCLMHSEQEFPTTVAQDNLYSTVSLWNQTQIMFLLGHMGPLFI